MQTIFRSTSEAMPTSNTKEGLENYLSEELLWSYHQICG
jgi:hypothetical protein